MSTEAQKWFIEALTKLEARRVGTRPKGQSWSSSFFPHCHDPRRFNPQIDCGSDLLRKRIEVCRPPLIAERTNLTYIVGLCVSYTFLFVTQSRTSLNLMTMKHVYMDKACHYGDYRCYS